MAASPLRAAVTAAVALAAVGGATILLVREGAEAPAADPGRIELEAAEVRLRDGAGAVGDSAEAEALAAAFLEALAADPRLAGKTPPEAVLCVRSPGRACFLVALPRLNDEWPRDGRAPLVDAAWDAAVAATADLPAGDDRRLAVALKGQLFYGGMAVGPAAGEEPRRESAGAIVTDPLLPFFVEVEASGPD